MESYASNLHWDIYKPPRDEDLISGFQWVVVAVRDTDLDVRMRARDVYVQSSVNETKVQSRVPTDGEVRMRGRR
jgi:hypothetical protein